MINSILTCTGKFSFLPVPQKPQVHFSWLETVVQMKILLLLSVQGKLYLTRKVMLIYIYRERGRERLMLFLNCKLSNQKARFVPCDQSITSHYVVFEIYGPRDMWPSRYVALGICDPRDMWPSGYTIPWSNILSNSPSSGSVNDT